MSTLYVTRGLPGSGKTTHAKNWVGENPKGRIRVNRDDIRMMLFGSKVGLSYEQEDLVTQVSRKAVKTGLRDGKDVIADDMHLRPKYIREMYQVAQSCEADDVVLVSFTPPLGILIDRQMSRPSEDMILPDVVRELYTKFTRKGRLLEVESYSEYLKSKSPQTSVENPYPPYTSKGNDLPKAILVDIDGTLALNDSGRGWFEWTKVGQDSLIESVSDLVKAIQTGSTTHVIYMSGRDIECYDETKRWLESHDLPEGDLIMRPNQDQRSDVIVKEELFNSHVRGKYNPWLVIDDRPSVCRMWRSLGLKVLQVGDPHVEF